MEPMLDARYDTISFKVVNDLLSHDSFKNRYDVRCQGNRAVAFTHLGSTLLSFLWMGVMIDSL